jgi:hypothetical protein
LPIYFPFFDIFPSESILKTTTLTTGLSEEEIQEMVLQAMLESGATPEEIAKVMVEQKLLQAIGASPEDMSKSILKQLRSGGKLSPEALESVLVSHRYLHIIKGCPGLESKLVTFYLF